MSYERKDIPALIAAFRAAKRHIIKTENTYFLCYALEKAKPGAREKAISLVLTSIEGFFTLTTWIRVTKDADFDERTTNLRQLRIDWCDKIIRDLQEYAK